VVDRLLALPSCKYTIEVRNDDEILAGHLREYIWHGGTAMEDIDTNNDGEVDIQTGEDWCFAYGEEDWVSGATVVEDGETIPKVFKHYRRDALLNNRFKLRCESIINRI